MYICIFDDSSIKKKSIINLCYLNYIFIKILTSVNVTLGQKQSLSKSLILPSSCLHRVIMLSFDRAVIDNRNATILSYHLIIILHCHLITILLYLTIEMPLGHWGNCNPTVNTPFPIHLKLTTILKKCIFHQFP